VKAQKTKSFSSLIASLLLEPFTEPTYDNVAYGPRIHGFARNKADLVDIVERAICCSVIWITSRTISTAQIYELIDELRQTYAVLIVTHLIL